MYFCRKNLEASGSFPLFPPSSVRELFLAGLFQTLVPFFGSGKAEGLRFIHFRVKAIHLGLEKILCELQIRRNIAMKGYGGDKIE